MKFVHLVDVQSQTLAEIRPRHHFVCWRGVVHTPVLSRTIQLCPQIRGAQGTPSIVHPCVRDVVGHKLRRFGAPIAEAHYKTHRYALLFRLCICNKCVLVDQHPHNTHSFFVSCVLSMADADQARVPARNNSLRYGMVSACTCRPQRRANAKIADFRHMGSWESHYRNFLYSYVIIVGCV